MSKTMKKEEMVNNSNQPQNQKPFDVVMNENFGKYQSEGFSRNWFIPIIIEQSKMDKLISIESKNSWSVNYDLCYIFPNTLLEVNKDVEGNISSIYVLYSKGGKLYKVVSQKDYGVIKSRMELKNGKYVPYEKCDLIPFDGTVKEYEDDFLKKSVSYKNGVKDGESITYYKDGSGHRDKESNEWVKEYYYEKTTLKNGKKNGEYENTKYGVKGNYTNNKKNGVWIDSYKNIYSNLKSSYQTKFDLSQCDLNKFIERNFGILSTYDIECLDKVGTVFYVNDVLNGDFIIKGYEGKFELGLPNGVVKNDNNNRWKDEITSKLYVDGIIDTEVHYDGGDREVYEEKVYRVENYENGFRKTSITLSTNFYNEIPTELTSITKQHLNEDLFYSIVKTKLNDGYTLESFLSDFEVINVEKYTDVDYRGKSKNIIKIETTELEYGFNNYGGCGLRRYLIEECDYPYFKERDKTYNGDTFYDIHTSKDYNYSSDFHPKVYSLIQTNEPTKLFINGELINETIDGETNPIVLEFQKEVLQKLSDKMKLSYEMELKRKELENKIEKEKKEKVREVMGLSLNSFPID
jgi:antitoxin component YwqK of YwqJK toxin-antitoxin module